MRRNATMSRKFFCGFLDARDGDNLAFNSLAPNTAYAVVLSYFTLQSLDWSARI